MAFVTPITPLRAVSAATGEKPKGSLALHERSKTYISFIFTKESQFPKLDVAGSTPVSRSIFSITWG